MSSRQNRFPPGWDEARVRRVLDRYENQTEDEAAFQSDEETFMGIPKAFVPAVRELLVRLQRQAR